MATVFGQVAAFQDGAPVVDTEIEVPVETLADVFTVLRESMATFEAETLMLGADELFVVFDVAGLTEPASVVPLPGALFMLAGALAALVARFRKQ